jgi:hypothetical protein
LSRFEQWGQWKRSGLLRLVEVRRRRPRESSAARRNASQSSTTDFFSSFNASRSSSNARLPRLGCDRAQGLGHKRRVKDVRVATERALRREQYIGALLASEADRPLDSGDISRDVRGDGNLRTGNADFHG